MNSGIIVSEKLLGYHQTTPQGSLPIYELLVLNEEKQCSTIYTTPLKSGTDIVYAERPSIERVAEPVVKGKGVQ